MSRFLDDHRRILAEGSPDYQAHCERNAATIRNELDGQGVPITLDTLDAFALGAVTLAIALGFAGSDGHTPADRAVGYILGATAAIQVPPTLDSGGGS